MLKSVEIMQTSSVARKIPSHDFQELSSPESSGRNWKGIGIALLVIAVICSLVILAIVLVAPRKYKKLLYMCKMNQQFGSVNGDQASLITINYRASTNLLSQLVMNHVKKLTTDKQYFSLQKRDSW